MSSAPPIFVVTGPSGVGKGTLIRRLRERHPGLELSISVTTRLPRDGERDGIDYHFKSDSEFSSLVSQDAFVEHVLYSDHSYGTLKSELLRHAQSGVGVLLEIELQGARAIRSALPEAMQIFIAPPSPEALRTRLVGRGTDTPDQIERRLEVADEELSARGEFEHVIVNDDIEDAVTQLDAVISTRHQPNS